jgi:hypothetical protein
MTFYAMFRHPVVQLARIAAGLALAAQLSGTQAAELGEARARSFIGQPLVAEIELTSLTQPGALVQVELASADVYKAANVAMPAGLAMVVERRGARQFLRVRSSKAADYGHVNLFFELSEGGPHVVRAVTVWLTPNPVPAPVVAAPVARAAPQAARPRTPPVAAKAVENEEALKQQNGELTAKLVAVEDKMKVLQSTIGVDAAPVPVPAPVPVAAPVKVVAMLTKPVPVPVVLEPVRSRAWLWISLGTLLLLLLAGTVYFILKRGKAEEEAEAVETAPGNVWIRLRERFRPKHWADGTAAGGEVAPG